MRHKIFWAALLFAGSVMAKNTTTTVEQVTSSIDVTGEVDYVITSTTPFGSMGSVNIADTEHAVVIIQSIKPSAVLANWMDYIYINGEKAVDGTNCQVKMFNRGAIIFPYASDFHPLTCYTEENYGGESYDNYTEGSSGGYMKTLSTNMLNNNIRSFKLKRGYMVTFAVGTGGWGYSRCFIADMEDLEVPVIPDPFYGKVSSYRLFKWFNAHKAGSASSGDYWTASILNASWCYDWAQGNASNLPDVEWVPNHIYEDYPSSSTCGSVTGSCHMKTNNEPGNSSDDHPQTVDEVLANWQNLMRTGLRLCSESSHDGSLSHLAAFVDSIDARGWRCDIVDCHAYWASSSFWNLEWWHNAYGNGRPVWISEWLWGASWNKNGIFGAVSNWDDCSTATQQTNFNTVKGILDQLNSLGYVERYAYWNGERNCSKLIYNGALTLTGQYYATMDDGLGYNANYEFIPLIVYKAPGALSGTYTKKTKTLELAWTDPNGDMIDSIVVECKAPGTSKWEKVDNVKVLDKNSADDASYTFSTTVTDVGVSYFRVREYYDHGKNYISDEYSVTVAAAESIGSLQYGQLKIANTESVTSDIETQEQVPYVITGLISNKNSANGITNQIQTMAKSTFKFRFYPWALETPVSFNSAETVDYMILPPDTIYQLNDDMMLISQKIGMVKGEEMSVAFPQAFPEGVTPVVVAQQNTSISSYAPVSVRVYDVTNTGFKVKLVRQEGVTTAFNGQNVNYFACSPGQIEIGNGKLLTVGRDYDTPIGGASRQTVYFKNADGDTLHLVNPYIIAAAQTNNYEATSIIRQHNTSSHVSGEEAVTRGSFRRQIDPTTSVTTTNTAKTNGDYIGWFIISDDPDGTGEEDPLIVPTGITSTKAQGFTVSTSGRSIYVDGVNMKAYNTNGQRVAFGTQLPAGIYIVTDGKKSLKVNVQ